MAPSTTPGSASADAGVVVCLPGTSTRSTFAPPKAHYFLVSALVKASVEAIIDATEVVSAGGMLFFAATWRTAIHDRCFVSDGGGGKTGRQELHFALRERRQSGTSRSTNAPYHGYGAAALLDTPPPPPREHVAVVRTYTRLLNV